jgi:transposase
MTKAKVTKQGKKARRTYTAEYKAEALALIQRIGVSATAQQLEVDASQLYAWRGKAWREQSQGEAERQLATENARLKRQLADQAEELAILKKATAYFAKSLK